MMPETMKPDVLTRVCFLVSAALPWYAVISGVYGLYFYVLLLVVGAGRILDGVAGRVVSDVLFAGTLWAGVALGALLLLVMPAGLVCAAFGCPPGGAIGIAVRCGCVASMVFAALYAAIFVAGWAGDYMGEVSAGPWWSGLVQAAALLCGMAVTGQAWRWLRRWRT